MPPFFNVVATPLFFFVGYSGPTYPRGRVMFRVHSRYLDKFVPPGDRVLEAGAGAGRFTIELARLGAQVTVADLSPAQLELNALKVAEAGHTSAVVERVLLDILDCSRFRTGSCDAVVCHGSPLSYVFDGSTRRWQSC